MSVDNLSKRLRSEFYACVLFCDMLWFKGEGSISNVCRVMVCVEVKGLTVYGV